MIRLVKDIRDANFITHAGKFHADEVFGAIMLEKIYGKINLIRVPEINEEEIGDKVVFDIGGGKFDHHQVGGNGQRDNGIKYAAFGLLWKNYGKQYLEKITSEDVEVCYNLFDKNFVQFIDAFDNGQVALEKIDVNVVSISDVIENMNPNWDENVDSDIKFEEAIGVARKVFDNKIKSTISKCKAKNFVDEAIEKSSNGIMILDKYMPYQEFVLQSSNQKAKDILYAVFPSNRAGYTVRCIAKEVGSFDCRKKFPKEWAGLRDKDLQGVTGVDSATFCHNALFICVADKFDDALKLAEMAVKA